MLITIVVVLLVLALVGGLPMHTRYGYAGSGGWIGTLLVILLILWLFGGAAVTCQCTCGKHILIDISKSVMIPVQAAAAAPGYPVTVHFGNTADHPQFIDFVPNTACAGTTMPTGFGIRIDP